MKIYEKVIWQDGGPNDKGIVAGYKIIENGEAPPKPKNGFETYREISTATYFRRKNEAIRQMKMFEDL